ncbi:MAG: YggS family pyridoxal phosphate-dependent enzyme [Pseudomonadota bacterium]|nr:YggS family pyridoxal phosphate-dependent enzyme [Pseudomonadota bacterium]
MHTKAPISDDEDIAIRLEKVKARMMEATKHSGLAAANPTLVAVSKTISKDPIETLLKCGHTTFGENKVQEASKKWPGLKAKYPGAKLHLIGRLQTNKVREAIELFDVIETVDRVKLAEELAKARDRYGFCPALLIQINTGCEPQKGGIVPAEADSLVQLCVSKLDLPVKGLMCIPPINAEPSLHFGLVRAIALRHELTFLSMGMSRDFEIALAFGATSVRVGTAIFGPREGPRQDDT